MADSETSRILPKMTRRNVLSGATMSAAGLALKPAFGIAPPAPASETTGDPALLAAQDWAEAHGRYVEANRVLLERENEFYRTTAWPAVEIKRSALQTGGFSISSNQDLDYYIAKGWLDAEGRSEIEANLAAKHSEWDRAATRTGYRLAERAEKHAWNKRYKLAVSLANTPALSLAGATAKLHSILEMKIPVNRRHPKWRPTDPEFRKSFVSPELDMLLADLERIGRLNHG
jgi:hypothetical protein